MRRCRPTTSTKLVRRPPPLLVLQSTLSSQGPCPTVFSMAITRRQRLHTQLQETCGLRSGAQYRLNSGSLPSDTGQPPTAGTVPKDSNKIGLPKHDEWALVTARERRFCTDHGEEEWLLQYQDRWMYHTDFGVKDAYKMLESRLDKYTPTTRDQKSALPASQAGCRNRLWSQVDTPIKRGTVAGKPIFLIRWKLQWTPESMVNNLKWARAAFRKVNKVTRRRQSSRVVESPSQRAARRKALMMVANLEDWL